MKRYIKPETTAVEIEIEAGMMRASGGDNDIIVDIDDTHETEEDRAKMDYSFNVWGDDEEEE